MSWRARLLPVLGSTLLLALAVPTAQAVPSFARQTGLRCDACHTSYPGLTAMGREFKLNGYTLSDLKKVEAKSHGSAPGMSINQIPNLSVILQMDETWLNSPVSSAQNPAPDFPKELGFYYAGRIAPHVGTFLQATYDSGGSLGMDMSDLRYVRHATLGGDDTIWGLDVNNGPTFEDVWNSTPGYGWPYNDNDAAAAPAVGPFLASDDVMTNVLGTGAYVYWNNTLYGYVGFYQSAKQGDTPATSGAIHGAAPYYRIAWTPTQNLELGSFGLFTSYRYGQWANNTRDGRINDVGVDAQYQMYPNPNNIYTFHASYINETRNNLANVLGGYTGPDSISMHFANVDANWIWRHRWGLGAGYFRTTGDTSSAYQSLYGINMDRPDTNGEIIDGNFYPVQNIRFSLEYIAYNKFDGASSNYNGAGRSASDNNTLMLNALFGF